ncbi:MAG: HTH-type transcriptional regulator GbpR [Variovorax sp.]|nr:MAG: HTH-type transcriptional regulator GbpR [Variovorax sp.]
MTMAKLDWYVRANLKFRHLQLLVALDDFRNMGKVAALLNVTQPALSKTLAELQSGLGVKLFERTGRGLRPTDYATVLIRHARRMLQELAEAGDELHAVATGTARRMRIGTQPASASWLLPQALARMKREAPDASIFVREGTMDLLLTELRMGNLDALVGTLPPRRENSDLEEKALFDDATGLVVRHGHPLTQQRAPGWADVARYPWVLPPPESLLRQPLLVAFSANGVEPPTNYIETLSLNVSLQYLQASDAVATLPVTVAKRLESSGLIQMLPLRLSRLMRPVGVMWLRAQAPVSSLRLLTTALEQAAEELLS